MNDGVKLQVKNILQLFYPHACNYCLQKKWNADDMEKHGFARIKIRIKKLPAKHTKFTMAVRNRDLTPMRLGRAKEYNVLTLVRPRYYGLRSNACPGRSRVQ